MPEPTLQPARAQDLHAHDASALRRFGQELRRRGYHPRQVAQSLGIIAWNTRDMDGPYWSRDNCADGELGDLVDVLIRGETRPPGALDGTLGRDAREAGLIADRPHCSYVDGTLLPLDEDLIFTDRADRSFTGHDSLFLPDSTTLAIRRCLPATAVRRHLDLGSGAGAVAVRAGRRADVTVALDINPRAALACQRTAALSGVEGVQAWTGDALAAGALCDDGAFERVSFVLPLMLTWEGMAELGPLHTIAQSTELLADLVRLLPRLMAPGGLALLYCQDWVGGQPIPDALDGAFGARPWRAVHWWGHEGEVGERTVRAGVLALVADQGCGWAEVRNEAPDHGESDWWSHLSPLLGTPQA